MKTWCCLSLAGFLFLLFILPGCGGGSSTDNSGGGSSTDNIKEWGATAELIEDGEGYADSPQVAVDGSGNAMVVWYQQDYDGVSNIYSNRYTAAAGSWATTVELVSDGVEYAYFPQVAVDGSGSAVAVWQQEVSGVNSIYSNRYTAATGSWAPTTELIEEGVGSAYGPEVAVDSSGNAVAVWFQDDGDPDRILTNIYSNRYTAAKDSWAPTTELIEDGVGRASHPQVAVDGSGNAVVVWVLSDIVCDVDDEDGLVCISYGSYVYSNRYTAATDSWAPTAELISDGVESVYSPQVAVDDSGNAVAVWSQQYINEDINVFNIYSNRYTAATDSWAPKAELVSDGVVSAHSPQVAVDGSDNAVAVWQQEDIGNDSIYSNRYTEATGSWAPTAELIEDGEGYASAPQVAVDGSGNAVAVWQQKDSGVNSIYSNRYTEETGSWAPKAEPIEDGVGSADRPEVAVDTSGNAVAVWRQNDGGINSIYSNRYE